jgi:hypothetical protein
VHHNRIIAALTGAGKAHGAAGAKNAAHTEAKLRDLFALLCLHAGAAPAELAFLYRVPPDGTRVEGLCRLLRKMDVRIGGLRLRLRLEEGDDAA